VVIGVTGLPASGKSTVSGMLAALGAAAVDADLLAHEAMDAPGTARRVERLLGTGVLRTDGSVDRGAVAARVFGERGAPALRRLEGLLHPLVRLRMRELVAAARRRRAPAVVLEVPLLFEAGLDRSCDLSVFVDAPRTVRLRRARARGWTGRDLRAREARQLPAAARRRRADEVVDNGGGRSATWRQVRALWARAVPAGSPRGGAGPGPGPGPGTERTGRTARRRLEQGQEES
jgi:dephospho-CoA kinase